VSFEEMVLEVSKEYDAFLLMGQEELDRLTLADECTTFFRNYGNPWHLYSS
jgi:hypothetical protein